MGKGYARFKREIVRAQDSGVKLYLIIEGTYTNVKKGYKHSSLRGDSITKKLHTLSSRYGLDFICCKDRTEMSQYIVDFYIARGREYLRRIKEGSLTK